jgi:predicted metal-dependent HD superfamily phosphohydrolase
MLKEITERYLEPHRHYHTLRHVVDMLERGMPLGLSNEQLWAIWGHDIVYNPGSKNNEIESADLTLTLMEQYGIGVDYDIVNKIILSTIDHQPLCPDAMLVIDLDLAGFSDGWSDYKKTNERIREEFSMVTSEQWREGRIAFLNTMLARQPFYLTEYFADNEKLARKNIETELEIIAL